MLFGAEQANAHLLLRLQDCEAIEVEAEQAVRAMELKDAMIIQLQQDMVHCKEAQEHVVAEAERVLVSDRVECEGVRV